MPVPLTAVRYVTKTVLIEPLQIGVITWWVCHGVDPRYVKPTSTNFVQWRTLRLDSADALIRLLSSSSSLIVRPARLSAVGDRALPVAAAARMEHFCRHFCTFDGCLPGAPHLPPFLHFSSRYLTVQCPRCNIILFQTLYSFFLLIYTVLRKTLHVQWKHNIQISGSK